MTDEKLKSYLFVIDSSTKSLVDAISVLDRDRDFVNWHKFLPDGATLVTRLDIGQVHEKIKAYFPRQRYILVRLDTATKNGWLPKDAWKFMNSPTAADE